MSFSQEVKEELIRLPLGKSCCTLRELCALVQTNASLSFLGAGRFRLTFETESTPLARRIFLLCRQELNATPVLHFVSHPRFGGRRSCVLTLEGDHARQLMEELRMMERDADGVLSFRRTVPRCEITRACCAKAFLRAAFLGSGNIISPEKEYHLEIVSDTEAFTHQLLRVLERVGIQAHVISRGSRQMIYLKESSAIVAFLGQIGAHRALMKMENVRASKTIRNQVNRMMNCDHGNMEKQLDAAQNQVDAISSLAISKGLESLPPALREVARLRLSRPDASIAELAQMVSPPISKSGMNHRLRRIMALAARAEESLKK